MKLEEVADKPTKAERSLKRIVTSIKREFAREFKNKTYEISWEMVNPTKGWIEVDINDQGLWTDEKSYDAMCADVERLIRADDATLSGVHEGGSARGKLNYAAFSVRYAANL